MISALNAVAMGDAKADLVLTNCALVNVYTRETTRSEIAIAGDRIAYVGPDASHAVGPETVRMDMAGRFVTPGLADPHIHIDQFVLPGEMARKSLLCGVTALFSDPIDIVSVAGGAGFRAFLAACSGLPIRIFNVVPGGLPVDPKFSHGGSMTTSQAKAAVRDPSVLGLGEVFSWTRVTTRDPKTMRDLAAMLQADCIINGHTAGASEKKLNAYIASGILSCHEPINFDQVLERLRLGMWVMIREGSIRRDLGEIIPKVLSHDMYIDRLMFCSDGLDPRDMRQYGHIDHCIRESVRLGVDPIDAVTMASKNCFDYYNMGRDLGGIAPGKLADMLVLDDLKDFRPDTVFVAGKPVVLGGRIVAEFPPTKIPRQMKNTVHLEKFSKNDFAVKSRERTVSANVIMLLTEIITKLETVELETRNETVAASPDRGIYKVAAFDRTGKTNKRAVGFLGNFGADIGAFASSWSFHENDLIVIGSNDGDMAAAANELIRLQGGMTVVDGGKTVASMPLQFGGIISTDSFEVVARNFADINSSIIDAGCDFKNPHLIPLFLPFLALPSVRILCNGIVDVKKRLFIPPISNVKKGQ